ncbi:hypothetical protein [uncultured Flavobacterium sp.]|uniref:hypothetical protein n=1 Tax=uncultured Flavobacterium sp. TaxID=165435 RepID=UPI0025CCE4B9|nr:hypothetical protein [uncultured Flavobacterium sp.]
MKNLPVQSVPNFSIDISCDDVVNRPQASHRVREYIEQFVLTDILLPKKIIVGAKMKTLLQVSLFTKGESYFVSLPPTTFKKENTRAYPVMVSPGDSMAAHSNGSVAFALLLYRAVTEFLITHYKKLTRTELEEIQQKMDIKYLESIPYPAPFDDQQYIMDDVKITTLNL